MRDRAERFDDGLNPFDELYRLVTPESKCMTLGQGSHLALSPRTLE